MPLHALLSWTLWIGTAAVVGSAAGTLVHVDTRGHVYTALSSSQSDSFKVRLAAVKLLARHEDRESALRLHAMANDPHPLVRRVVEATLARQDLAAALCRPVATNEVR